MNHLFKEFPVTSKEEWLKKIESDLKGKVLTDLDSPITEHWMMSPFWHGDDIENKLTPILSKSSNDWLVGESFLVSDIPSTNESILSALNNGVNSIKLEIEKPLNLSDLSALLDKINLEFITADFVLGEDLDTSHFLGLLNEHLISAGLDHKLITGSIRKANYESFEIDDTIKSKFLQFSFNYLVEKSANSTTENCIDGLTSLLVKLIVRIERCTPEARELFCLDLRLGKNYFLNIAKIRSAKILWNNIVKAYNAKLHLRIIASGSQNESNSDEELIASPIQCIAAATAGVDTIYFNNLKDGVKKNVFLKKNISSILQMESYYTKVADPAAGSYYIEALTEQLSQQVWSKFQNQVS